MLKKCTILLMVLLIWGAGSVQAADQATVAVFPFDVFSSQPMDTLKQQMQGMLRERLIAQGVKVIDAGKVNQALKRSGQTLDLSQARRIAGDLGADFAVYGSLTKIGSRLSLDVKILDSLGMNRPQSSFVEGVGLDTLQNLAGKLAQDIAVKVSGQEKVAQVIIEGNRRIESAAITAILKTKAGGAYSPLVLDKDLREIWKMGYFDNVQVKTTDSPKGKVVAFVVTEKPSLKEVRISGAEAYDKQDIIDQIGLKVPDVFRAGLLKEAEAKIVKLYHEKGYYDVKIKTKTLDLPKGDKAIVFDITEGKQIYISRIKFEGNKAYSDDDLKEEMTTAEEGWLSWFMEDNVLKRAVLDQDRERINDFYFNNGYLTARVGEPKITREKDGLVVTFQVVEGKRFKVKKLQVSGDMVMPKKELMPKLQTKSGDWFSRAKVRQDMLFLHDLYADKGYAYVEVRPQVRENTNETTVDIGFGITRGKKVYFERILITGNDATRDNVIRRLIDVAEGDLFSASALRKSNTRLRQLNFFEDVRITTEKGTTPDKMDLRVNVKEKRTGNISMGVGYSTADNLMLVGSAAENNLLGTGRRLELRASTGSTTTRYELSYTEPWLFDRPISAGVDFYNWTREYTSYDKDSLGARFRVGMPTGLPHIRFYFNYRIEEAEVTGVDDDASLIIRDQQGRHTTSAVKFTLRRDTRDKAFGASRGTDHRVSFEYAGDPIGGTNTFMKAIGDTSWYFPIYRKHTIMVHGRVGWLAGHSGGNLPIYEKFFLGGINDLRGFDRYSVSPKDPATGDEIGGERMAFINLEYRFPLMSDAGVMGVVFYDTGNSWTEEDGYDLGEVRSSVGAGIRWYSPVGPLRLEYGYVLDPEPGEANSNFEFTIGQMF
jgi:outer membrane protein insertion porin family